MATPKRRRRSRGGSDAGLQAIKYAIVRAFRRLWWQYHEPRKNVIKAATVRIYKTKKDGSLSKQFVNRYQCSRCSALTEKYAIDHIVPIGKQPDFPPMPGELEEWVKKLFCPADNLELLCRPCHQAKTNAERRKGAYRC